jgi:hypothetical protein
LKVSPDGSVGEIDHVGKVPVTTGFIADATASKVKLTVDGEYEIEAT